MNTSNATIPFQSSVNYPSPHNFEANGVMNHIADIALLPTGLDSKKKGVIIENEEELKRYLNYEPLHNELINY